MPDGFETIRGLLVSRAPDVGVGSAEWAPLSERVMVVAPGPDNTSGPARTIYQVSHTVLDGGGLWTGRLAEPPDRNGRDASL
jgi:hypothetical protein